MREVDEGGRKKKKSIEMKRLFVQTRKSHQGGNKCSGGEVISYRFTQTSLILEDMGTWKNNLSHGGGTVEKGPWARF